MLINQTNLNNLTVGYKAAFNKAFHDTDSLYQVIATIINSKTATETYAWLGQYPRFREWVGDREFKDMEAHGYSIVNKKFEASINVKRDDIEDDQYGVYSPMMAEMGYAAKTHPDELVFGLLAKGTSAACYDGNNFFDIEHPSYDKAGVATVVSNYQAGTGDLWVMLDCSRPLKPVIFQKRKDYQFRSQTTDATDRVFMRDEFAYGVDARVNVGFGFWQQAYASTANLTKANFEAARLAMRKLNSDKGRPLGIKPTHIVVHPNLQSTAEELFKNNRLAGGANNPLYDAVKIIVADWFDV